MSNAQINYSRILKTSSVLQKVSLKCTLLVGIQRFLSNSGLGSISITVLITAVLYHILSLGNDKLLSLRKFRKSNRLKNKGRNFVGVTVRVKAKSFILKEATISFHTHTSLIKPTVNILLK